jgi:hypothetical protein
MDQQVSRRSLGKGFVAGLGVGLSTIWTTRSYSGQYNQAIAATTAESEQDKDNQKSNASQSIIKPPMLKVGDRVGMGCSRQ